MEFSTWNPESTARNPESKTVLDSLTWGGEFFREGYSLVKGALSLNSAKDKDLSLVSHRRPYAFPFFSGIGVKYYPSSSLSCSLI